MRRLFILLAANLALLTSCDIGNISSSLHGIFTIKGCIVAAPTNTPLADVFISVTNNNYTIASATSDVDGMFTISIDKTQFDNSYFINIVDPETNVTKQMDLTGIGMTEYNYGNIILYDSRNPYSLPTFEYQNKTYVVHPILRREYTLSELDDVCDNIHDYGINNWFLPSELEFRKIIGMTKNSKLDDLIPGGLYWVSDFDGKYQKYMWYDGWNSIEIHESSNSDQLAHIVPVSMY